MKKIISGIALALTATGGASAETLIERGSYLVNAVMACDNCHTPREKGELVIQKRFAGGSQVWDTPAYTVRGTNVTPDAATGIGRWTTEQIKRSLIEGVRPTGVPLSPQMPFPFYKIMTQRDLDALVAYMKSLPAVNNAVPPPLYKAAMRVDPVPGATAPYTEAELKNTQKRGFYLATLAHCMECHARRPDGTQDYEKGWGKGGYVFKGPWGSAVTSNITSHPTVGIGAWTDAELRRSLTHGVARDGRAFKPPMARAEYFSRMTAADLDALVGWMRAIPPLD
jgi:hypothetical protein